VVEALADAAPAPIACCGRCGAATGEAGEGCMDCALGEDGCGEAAGCEVLRLPGNGVGADSETGLEVDEG
jgi:hypothetical protein